MYIVNRTKYKVKMIKNLLLLEVKRMLVLKDKRLMMVDLILKNVMKMRGTRNQISRIKKHLEVALKSKNQMLRSQHQMLKYQHQMLKFQFQALITLTMAS